MIFFVILIMVCCVYLLESLHEGDSNENTAFLHGKENRKDIPIMPPDLTV